MSPGVALQVKGVIEALSAEGAEIALGVAVTLHVPVEKALQPERLAADPAGELAGVGLAPQRRQLLHLLLGVRGVAHHRVLDPVPAIDQL